MSIEWVLVTTPQDQLPCLTADLPAILYQSVSMTVASAKLLGSQPPNPRSFRCYCFTHDDCIGSFTIGMVSQVCCSSRHYSIESWCLSLVQSSGSLLTINWTKFVETKSACVSWIFSVSTMEIGVVRLFSVVGLMSFLVLSWSDGGLATDSLTAAKWESEFFEVINSQLFWMWQCI